MELGWERGKMNIRAKITKNILDEIDKTDKVTVFLGGECDKENPWRKELKKALPDVFFVDPYDENWGPDAIYRELEAMLKSDYVIFHKGGKGTINEKAFLDGIKYGYYESDDIEHLKNYIMDLSKPNKQAGLFPVTRGMRAAAYIFTKGIGK